MKKGSEGKFYLFCRFQLGLEKVAPSSQEEAGGSIQHARFASN